MPKSALSDTSRRRYHPRKAQSETRLPQTSFKLTNDGQASRSLRQNDKPARHAARLAQSERLPVRNEAENSGYVAHLTEAPPVKPRKSITCKYYRGTALSWRYSICTEKHDILVFGESKSPRR